MKKIILTILGSALLAASIGQAASAAEHHVGRKANRAPPISGEQFRKSNAYVLPSASVQPDWSRYANGASSAPAGR
jgi:Ni/Co efflux regulator RcnB